MFYRPENGHGLPHNPFNAIVTPRPIGWISTRGAAGDNLAPYSFFNGVAYTPPQVVFSSTEEKDSLRNLRETGVFAVNVVEYAMREKMNATSGTYPPGTDEFDLAGIEKAPCETIDCPRVAGAPAKGISGTRLRAFSCSHLHLHVAGESLMSPRLRAGVSPRSSNHRN